MRFKFFSVILMALGICQADAQSIAAGNPEDAARIKHFRLTRKRVGINGYDPVSYFKTGPEKGSASRKFAYNGVIYFFANDANLKEFMKAPDKYEPAWGGWCGHAMAFRGEKVTINPKCYKIIDGRNVLFYKTSLANALANWERDIKNQSESDLVKMGNQYWEKTLNK